MVTRENNLDGRGVQRLHVGVRSLNLEGPEADDVAVVVPVEHRHGRATPIRLASRWRAATYNCARHWVGE